METFAYFNDIHQQIMKELEQAEFEIIIAVAWFTDKEIFQLLCKRAVKGVSVRIALVDDAINKRAPFEYDQLRECGGEVYLIPNEKSRLMHHKFCVIDRNKVITGSFNWSKKAQRNDENIVIIKDAADFSIQYIDTFNQLLAKHHYSVIDIPKLNPESIAIRLELIKNFILLGEYNDVAKHIDKLKEFSNEEKLQNLVILIEQQEYDEARAFITDYLTTLRGLVKFNDPIINRLKQELLTLEYQFNALSDEKAEVERQIYSFNYQYNLNLGDLILEYLELKKVKSKTKYEEAKKNQKEKEIDDNIIDELFNEYEEAQSDQDQFKEGYKAFQEEDEIIQLSRKDAKELKNLYRKSSMLCHPDRVSEKDKKRSHEIFIKLQKAYETNDLESVRSIYNTLKDGNMFTDISSEVSEIDQLKTHIAELKIKIDSLVQGISEAINTDTYQTLKELTSWEVYFKEIASEFQQEVDTLKEELND